MVHIFLASDPQDRAEKSRISEAGGRIRRIRPVQPFFAHCGVAAI
jgi:hypothetical protein